MSSYDVIVIGTGAGGGTLARHLAPSGKRDPAARARRLAAPRAGELVDVGRVRRRPLHLAGQLVRREGQVLLPAAGALLRRRRHQAVRRRAVPDARAGLRRNAPPRRPVARLAHQLPGHGAVLHRRRADVPGARGARRGPDRTAGQRAVPVSRGLPRAAHPAALRRPGEGRATTRSTRRAASWSTRRTCPTASACAARTATASRARCTPSPTPRCSASAPPSSTPTSRCCGTRGR